jgi:hypothetical protein
MKIEGERVERFRVYWCDINNDPYEVEAEYQTVAEVLAHRFRLDRRYKIAVAGKYLTKTEFEAWAKSES